MSTHQVATAAETDLEYFRLEQFYRTVRTGIKGVCWVVAVFGLAKVIEPLAGQNTALSIAVSLLADAKLTVAITIAGATAAWALIERHLRYKKTEYLQTRIRQLEARLDPKRSTTGLTAKGKTNPKDKTV